jgi:hypothetical protein
MPEDSAQSTYDRLYALYSKLYFAFGKSDQSMGDILPTLIAVAESAIAPDKH